MGEDKWEIIDETTSSGRTLFRCSGCGEKSPAPEKGHVCGPKTKRLKLDPNLADGQHWTIHDRPDATLLELLQLWFDEAAPGEGIELNVTEMTDHEVEGLPDI